ncbi:protein obstructor-E [Octopus bimaculoides]|uniref:Chitin-binding type-2 domain-containing protein n=1 Tax=Octopus bimaculoides TaxID=37653 RepID=A0A0L8H4B4_OCTBM|nr:protein obstructor-E [Octopus bimaculoides]|eukprot:XP_014775642.1 PREDICTED: peritrophin-44-like [Octopus bimaculoides]
MWSSKTILFIFLVPLLARYAKSQDDNFGADPGCRDPWTSEWTRDPNDCTRVHYCVQGKQIWSIKCNNSRIWSNVGHACVEPMSQWDDCNQTPTTPSINDPRCINPDGINPDPENCAQFLACTNRSVVATMQCPESTLFSTRNNTCDLGFLVAEECKNRVIPSHVVVSTASPTIDKPCAGTEFGDVPDINNCGRFYKCNHGRVVARIKCPAGSAFSLEKLRCDWRASVICGERPL